jgi:hypothetical protein
VVRCRFLCCFLLLIGWSCKVYLPIRGLKGTLIVFLGRPAKSFLMAEIRVETAIVPSIIPVPLEKPRTLLQILCGCRPVCVVPFKAERVGDMAMLCRRQGMAFSRSRRATQPAQALPHAASSAGKEIQHALYPDCKPRVYFRFVSRPVAGPLRQDTTRP